MRINHRPPQVNIIYVKAPPIIHYVYVDAPPPPRHITQAAANLETAILNTKDPVKLKKLKELSKLLQTILAKIKNIESSGIRDMLYGMVDKAMNAIAQGNLDLALDIMTATNDMCDKCSQLIEKIRNNIHLLRTLDVQGPAAKLIKAIADAAQLALNGASCLEDLQELGNLTDKAVSIAKQMVGLKPGTKEYNELFGALQGVLAEVMAMKMAAYSPDDSEIGGESSGGRITRHIQDMLGDTQDPDDQNKLMALQDALLELQAQGEGLPNQKVVEGQINDILNKAKEGKLGEALAEANKLKAEVGRHKALDTHCSKRMHRLKCEVDRLEGPARKMMDTTMAKLQAMRDACNSPEEYKRVDAMIEKALNCCAGCQKDQTLNSPSYQELLKLNKELSSLAPGDGSPQAPSFGSDSYGPSKPASTGSTAPLTSPGSEGPANFGPQLGQLRQIAGQCSGASCDAMTQLCEVAEAQCAQTKQPQQIALLKAALSAMCESAAKLPALSPGSPEFDDAMARLRAKLASACPPMAKKKPPKEADPWKPFDVVIDAIVIPTVDEHHGCKHEPSPGAPEASDKLVAPTPSPQGDSGGPSPGM